jgi:hypothetical protein
VPLGALFWYIACNHLLGYNYIIENILMDVFITGLIVLFVVSAIFYAVLFTFIYYWHLRRVTFVVVPMIFAFEFFAIGFLIVVIVSIILDYVPILVRAAGI